MSNKGKCLHFAFRIIRCMFSNYLLVRFYVTKINRLSCHLKRNAHNWRIIFLAEQQQSCYSFWLMAKKLHEQVFGNTEKSNRRWFDEVHQTQKYINLPCPQKPFPLHMPAMVSIHIISIWLWRLISMPLTMMSSASLVIHFLLAPPLRSVPWQLDWVSC